MRRPKLNLENLHNIFESAHAEGSSEFGMLWLSANQAAINAALHCDLKPEDLQIKALLSSTVLRVLRLQKQAVQD